MAPARGLVGRDGFMLKRGAILAICAALMFGGAQGVASPSQAAEAAVSNPASVSTSSDQPTDRATSKRTTKAVCSKLTRSQRATLRSTDSRKLSKKACRQQLRLIKKSERRSKKQAAKLAAAQAAAEAAALADAEQAQQEPTQEPTPQPTTPPATEPTPEVTQQPAPVDPQPTPDPTIENPVTPAPSDPITQAPYAGNPTVFGLSANGEAALKTAEQKLGITAGVVGVFADFTMPFPTADAAHAADRGAALLISWEPWDWDVRSQDQPAYSLDNIAAGDFDPYIRQFARDAAATGRPVHVRFAAEMNGDWHVWSTGANGNGTGDYAQAFRHVVETARDAGGTNIKWMFNPIISYEGSTPLSSLYPGDSYVDWVALDGYNWGSLKWGWQSFTDIFTMGLAEIKTVAPDKPLAIAEVGSTPGEDKAAWVTDTLTRAKDEGVRMVVWFEHNKETDWRLSSDPEVAAATRAVVEQPGWVTGGDYSKVRAALGD